MAGRTLRCMAIVATVLAALGGCATSSTREPTVTTVNFTPKVVLEVTDDGFVWKEGANKNPGATVPPNNEPPTVQQGTVMDVRNTGRADHWVQGGKSFDTGQIKPGQATVVVLSETITEPKKIDITDRNVPGHTTSLTLVPRPQPS